MPIKTSLGHPQRLGQLLHAQGIDTMRGKNVHGRQDPLAGIGSAGLPAPPSELDGVCFFHIQLEIRYDEASRLAQTA